MSFEYTDRQVAVLEAYYELPKSFKRFRVNDPELTLEVVAVQANMSVKEVLVVLQELAFDCARGLIDAEEEGNR